MNYIWFLAAAGVLVAGIAFKRWRSRADKRRLSPFQQSRPIPDLGSSTEQAMQEKVRSGLLNLAHTPDHNLAVSSEQNTGQQPPAIIADAPSETVAATAHSQFGGLGHGVNRISTWDNRRLFSDFRGILNEDSEKLDTIPRDDLPMREDEMLFGGITPSVAQMLPETISRRETQRKNLVAAGYFSRASWINLTAARFILAFFSVVFVGILLLFAPPVLEPWLLALLVITPLLAWAVPPLIVSVQASERRIDIERGLPDVLDMMNMGVSQGLTVPQSLKRIGHEIRKVHPALSEELLLVNQQAEVGSMPLALRSFSQRIDSPEVNSFTSLLIQSEVTGTSISRSLTEYSDGIRSSLKERADSRANLASFQLLFPIALLLMPSVFLFLLGPAIVEMSNFFNNQAVELQQDRREAVRTLDQAPQLNNSRLSNQFRGSN